MPDAVRRRPHSTSGSSDSSRPRSVIRSPASQWVVTRAPSMIPAAARRTDPVEVAPSHRAFVDNSAIARSTAGFSAVVRTPRPPGTSSRAASVDVGRTSGHHDLTVVRGDRCGQDAGDRHIEIGGGQDLDQDRRLVGRETVVGEDHHRAGSSEEAVGSAASSTRGCGSGSTMVKYPIDRAGGELRNRDRSLAVPARRSLTTVVSAMSAATSKSDPYGDEDHDLIRSEIRRLCEAYGNEYWRWLEPDRYPEEFVAELTRQGWLGALIPEEYGGGGLSLAGASVILEEISARGATRLPATPRCTSWARCYVTGRRSRSRVTSPRSPMVGSVSRPSA